MTTALHGMVICCMMYVLGEKSLTQLSKAEAFLLIKLMTVQLMINFFSVKKNKTCRKQWKVEIARFFYSNRLESRTQQNGCECKLLYHHFFDKLAFINCIIINFILVDSTNLKVLMFLHVKCAVLTIP